MIVVILKRAGDGELDLVVEVLARLLERILDIGLKLNVGQTFVEELVHLACMAHDVCVEPPAVGRELHDLRPRRLHRLIKTVKYSKVSCEGNSASLILAA